MPPSRSIPAPGLTPRVEVAGLALLALGSGALTAAATAPGWLYYDDFWNLSEARSLGWGWDLVGRPVFGHVTPGANVVIGLVAGVDGATWGAARASLVVLGALLPLAVWAAARARGASAVGGLAAAAAGATGVAVAAGSTWWSAGLNSYPSAIGSALVVAGTGWARTAPRSGPVVAAAGLALALSFSEGAVVILLVPPLLAALDAGPGWRARVAAVVEGRTTWLIVASPLVAALVVRASAAGPLESHPRAALTAIAAFPARFVVEGFLPTLAGLAPGRVELLGSPVLTTLAGLVAAVAVTVVLGRAGGARAVAAGAIALLVVAARGALVAWSRLGLLGDAAVELRYLADLVWLGPVLVAASLTSDREHRHRAPLIRLVGVVVLAGLVGQAVLVAGAPARESRAYRDALVDSWEERPAGAGLLDVTVPAEVLGPQFGEFLFLSRTLVPAEPRLRIASAEPFVAPDERGRLRPVRLAPYAELRPAEAFTAAGQPGVSHDGGCWVAGTRGALVWVPLDLGVTSAPWVLDLRLAGRSSSSIGLVAAGRAPVRAIGTSPAGRSERRWVASTLPFAATQVGFVLDAGERLCLASGRVTLPEPVA